MTRIQSRYFLRRQKTCSWIIIGVDPMYWEIEQLMAIQFTVLLGTCPGSLRRLATHHSNATIGSTSKLITVYLLLLQSGEEIFGQKVTQYLPELSGVSFWDEITVGSLAGFLGGIVAERKSLS
jgi:hypothetical protein